MIFKNCNVETDPNGHERKEHGTALLPVVCYEDNLLTQPFPCHWHDEWEATFVAEGNAEVSVGSECRVIPAGGGYLVNAGALHSGGAANEAPCTTHTVVFHPRLVGGGMDSVFWQRYILPVLDGPAFYTFIPDGEQEWHRQAAQAIEKAWQAGAEGATGFEFAMRAALSELILGVFLHIPSCGSPLSEKALRDNERMKCMLLYIREHYQEQITVEEIARSAAISVSECARCFKNIVKTTPIRYVRQYRLQQAAAMLRSTERKITEIGEACGFQEMSYFTRAFRDMWGCTPTEYREASGSN